MKKLLLTTTALLGITSYAAQKPNVIVILADDMGFSDIGCFGGEIPTPNLDSLAKHGVRLTQFYNCARSCPSRASLLTGLYPHQAGIGHMSEEPEQTNTEDWGTDGYRGFLNQNCVTIAEALKQNGYNTYMTGKWHVGANEESRKPLQRGFDKFYGILAGASSYLAPSGNRSLTYQNTKQPVPKSPYYTTDAFTDSAMAFIKSTPKDEPFFLYLAYNAPHWPLQAPVEDIAKFRGKYKDLGWDQMRINRLQKQKELGLSIDDNLSVRDSRIRAWNNLSDGEKKTADYKMATYAAMVNRLDLNVGKVIEYLKTSDKLDNSLIIFLSDNGACAEPLNELGAGDTTTINVPSRWDGCSIGLGWANACNTPLYHYKSETFEGGMSTCFIAHWPDYIKNQTGRISKSKGYLIDLMPTILDATGTQYPKSYNGKEIKPLEGNSLLPVFAKDTLVEHKYMFWEHENHTAIRKGDWKAVKDLYDINWRLYNISTDRRESTNLAQENKVLVNELDSLWYRWAESHNVLPKLPKVEVDSTKKLIFHYPFNDNFEDNSPNKYELTVNAANPVKFDVGKYGKGALFSGSSQFLDLKTNNLLNPQTSQFTVCVWLKSTATAVPSLGVVLEEIILAQLDGTTTAGRPFAYARVDEQGSFNYCNFLGYRANPSSPGSYVRNEWVHLAIVFDAREQLITYYINGEKDSEVKAAPFEKCDGGFRIGGHKLNRNYWKGMMDELFLYQGKLSQSEIIDVMNNNFGTNQLIGNSDNSNLSVYHDILNKKIRVKSDVSIESISLFDSRGIELIVVKNTDFISTKDLISGAYIIKITHSKGRVFSQKLIL